MRRKGFIATEKIERNKSIAIRILRDGFSIAETAKEFGISITTTINIFHKFCIKSNPNIYNNGRGITLKPSRKYLIANKHEFISE